MNNRMLGAILLIIGTSIGGGILGLPIAAACGGYFNAILFLVICWALMTFGGLLILEVNLWHPPGSHLLSMARDTIGVPGQIISWVTYTLLLYTLIAAYISSGSDVLQGLFHIFNVDWPMWVDATIFTLIFGFIVFLGITIIDYSNRAFMILKFISLFTLIGLLAFHTSPDNFAGGQLIPMLAAVTVMITSFGSATIVPSLRVYLDSDPKKLRLAIIIGSVIPLFCYIGWMTVIFGAIPREGEFGLLRMAESGHSTTDIVRALNHHLQSHWVTRFAGFFTSICVLTSFLGVSLSLSDFLYDGLNLKKRGIGRIIVMLLTFIPPFLVAVFYQNAFIKGLSLAGIFCIILLLMMPVAMAYSGRYMGKIASGYQVFGGRITLGIAAFAGIIFSGLALHWDLGLI